MRFSLLILSALIPGSLARYDVVCRDAAGASKIENAIQEAIKMARNAHDKIGDLSEDTTKAAFEPLFDEDDVTTLRILYQRVINLSSSSLKVTFYCDSSFINWSDPFSLWIDSDYTYKATDPVTHQEITRGVSIYRVGSDHSKKPGNSGSSFSTLGHRDTLTNGDVIDFSDQAHIMVNKKRWDPPSADSLDHRSLDTVKADGLREGYTALDQLKPLSETVFHELMHVFGGVKNMNSPGKRITDRPITGVVSGGIYGFKKCVEVQQKRNNPVAIADGASPLTRADCPTILAKALYLQIKGRSTYWSTGTVDRDTLRPDGLSENSDDTSKREIMWFA